MVQILDAMMRRYCRATEQEDPAFVLQICCFHQGSNGVAILAHATDVSGGRTGIPPNDAALYCTVPDHRPPNHDRH